MSEADVLRQMVLSFRVTELQVLLGFAGKNKTGKKNELQNRALDLLRQRNTPIYMKIRELHKRYPSNSSLDLNNGNSNDTSDSYVSPSSPVKVSHYNMSHQSLMQVPMNLHPGSSQMGYRNSGSGKHSSMMGSSSGTSGFPVHPDVRFKALPFYDILAELLKPTSLCTAPNAPSRFQETNFVFHLTPQQANDVAMSRDVRPNIKNEYSVQIQLRFCLLETSCEQEDNFPPSICVKVNSKICALPNPIPTNKPGVEPKRPSRPVNITNLCKLCPTVPNYVTVSWASEYGRAYVIGVYLVKRLNSSTLLQRLRAVGVRNPDHTRAMIKEKLQQDPDSEIATTSLRGSLMCPLGKMRMHIPCRAKTCNHLQCFDASLYLQMNEKKPTWICPVCDKAAIFKDLVIDGLFMEITTKAPSSCNEVQFHDDGSWTPLVAKKETVTISASSLGASSKASSSSSSYSSPKRSSSSSAPPEKKKQKVEIVDLTCDSSTDEYDDETDTSSPMAVYNTNSTASSSQSNNQGGGGGGGGGNQDNSSLPNIPASIQVISLPSPSSLSSCSNSSNSSHSSNNSSSSNNSGRNAAASGTSAPTPAVSSNATTTTTASSRSGAVAHITVANRGTEGGSNSNEGGSNSAAASVHGASASSVSAAANSSGSSLYPNMPIIDASNNAAAAAATYYPPVSSPLHEFLNPMYNSYSSGFDLYSMLQPNEADRQMPSYSTVPSSSLGGAGGQGRSKGASGSGGSGGSAPDVISLD